jgi:hypothetical protein
MLAEPGTAKLAPVEDFGRVDWNQLFFLRLPSLATTFVRIPEAPLTDVQRLRASVFKIGQVRSAGLKNASNPHSLINGFSTPYLDRKR